MSRRKKNLRAFLHQTPNPTIEQAWAAAWEGAQKHYHSKRMNELEAENHRLTTEAIEEWEVRVGEPKITRLEAQVAELEDSQHHYFNLWNDQRKAALADQAQVAELKDENAGLLAAIESIQAVNDTLLDKGEV